jgi:hypothetical protein
MMLRRRHLPVLLAAALALGVSTTAAAGGEAPITVTAVVGGPCLSGERPEGAAFRLSVRDEAGRLQDRIEVAGAGTAWRVCPDADLRPGSTLTLATDDATRTVRIPRLSVRAHRPPKLVTGRAPADSQVQVTVTDCTLDHCSGGGSRTWTVEVTGDGTFRQRVPVAVELDGGDRAGVVLTTAGGDTFSRATVASHLRVDDGGSVQVGCPPGPGRVVLRRADGTLRGTAELTGRVRCGEEEYRPLISVRGRRIRHVHAGDVATARFAPHMAVEMPELRLRVDGLSVRGRCMPRAPYEVLVDSRGSSQRIAGEAGHAGQVRVAIDPPGSGSYGVQLVCETVLGDQVSTSRFFR